MKKMKCSAPVPFVSNSFILAGFWLLVSSFFIVCQAAAADYVQIDLWPPHPGVFSDVGQQQFTAYGITPAGQRVDITDQVDWYLAAYPFQSQELEPYEVAAIDENGLLTINEGVTWGRVTVKACYPKGCSPVVAQYKSGRNLMSSISILLTPKFLVTSSATAGGSIGPAGTLETKKGSVEDFSLTPDTCYKVSGVNSTCGGALNGSTFTTDPVVSDCAVEADFVALPDPTATPAAINGGNDAGGAKTVPCGSTAVFTFGPPTTGGHVAIIDATDTCGGTLTDMGGGNWNYDSGPIISDCNAVVAFVQGVTVNPAVANGTVNPNTTQTVPEGSPVVFTFTPTNAPCDIAQIDATNDTCGGTLTDNLNGTWDYTLASATVNCDAAVEFVTPNYTATPSAVYGTAPAAQTVACGEVVTLTFGPPDNAGEVATLDNTDTCGGTLSDNGNDTWDYTISSLTGGCNAVVRFLPTHTATPAAINGTNDSGGAQTVTDGSPVTFTFTATTAGDVATLDGTDTCGGSLTDNGNDTWDYTIASLTGDCNAVVNFVTPQFRLTLNAVNSGGDGRVYSNVGEADCDTTGAVYGTCPSSFDYDSGTVITLNHQEVLVVPTGTWVGWSGDPDCADGQVTMNANVSCTGTFAAP